MNKIPEECPVRDILGNIKAIIDLLDKILDHCEKCSQGKEGKNEQS